MTAPNHGAVLDAESVGCAETPLQDLLRRVPRDFIARWDIPEEGRELWQLGSASSPVGLYCHRAADQLDALLPSLDREAAIKAVDAAIHENWPNSRDMALGVLEVAQKAYRLARPTPEGETTPSITAPMESETAIEVSKRAKALSELATLDGETMDLPAQLEPGAQLIGAEKYEAWRASELARKQSEYDRDTPEPGAGELEVVAWLVWDRDDGIMPATRSFNELSSWKHNDGLVRQTQAQAKIARLEREMAERDARIAELVNLCNGLEAQVLGETTDRLDAEADAAKVREVVKDAEAVARQYADCYPEGSDGRNTLTMLADYIAVACATPLAALSAPAPQGIGREWQPIETMPVGKRVLIWVTGNLLPGVRFGSAYRSGDRIIAKPEGANGDWTKEVVAWQPLPEPPAQGEG